MATGDMFAIKMHMVFAGQECRPGFYLAEGTGGSDPNPVANATAAVKDALGDDPLAGFSAHLSLTAIEGQDIQPATTRTFLDNYVVPLVGDQADDNAVPPQDSMLLRWLTDLKGGKGKFARRGRTYLPGIYSTGQISGFLVADLQDALRAFALKLNAAFVNDATAYQMHAVAFVPASKPRVISEIHPITQFSVDNVVAIQRSRRPGRGI